MFNYQLTIFNFSHYIACLQACYVLTILGQELRFEIWTLF
jgi:hypothetical protein